MRAGVNDTAAVRVVGVVDSMEAAEMFVKVADELITEDAPTFQTEVDSIDVSGEVGRLEANTADRTGRETPAVHRGDMIVQSGHTDSTPGTGALEAPVFSEDVSLERGLALEPLGAVPTPSLQLTGGNQERLQQPRMVDGLVFVERGRRGEWDATTLTAMLSGAARQIQDTPAVWRVV